MARGLVALVAVVAVAAIGFAVSFVAVRWLIQDDTVAGVAALIASLVAGRGVLGVLARLWRIDLAPDEEDNREMNIW